VDGLAVSGYDMSRLSRFMLGPAVRIRHNLFNVLSLLRVRFWHVCTVLRCFYM